MTGADVKSALVLPLSDMNTRYSLRPYDPYALAVSSKTSSSVFTCIGGVTSHSSAAISSTNDELLNAPHIPLIFMRRKYGPWPSLLKSSCHCSRGRYPLPYVTHPSGSGSPLSPREAKSCKYDASGRMMPAMQVTDMAAAARAIYIFFMFVCLNLEADRGDAGHAGLLFGIVIL